MILDYTPAPSDKPSIGSMSPGAVFEYDGIHYLRMKDAGCVTGLAKAVNIVTGAPAEFMYGTLATPYTATVRLKVT